jgi:hypothetical protein
MPDIERVNEVIEESRNCPKWIEATEQHLRIISAPDKALRTAPIFDFCPVHKPKYDAAMKAPPR